MTERSQSKNTRNGPGVTAAGGHSGNGGGGGGAGGAMTGGGGGGGVKKLYVSPTRRLCVRTRVFSSDPVNATVLTSSTLK